MSEASVSFEDQNRINSFSSKSVAQAFLEDRHASLKKVLEANKDALEELELVLDEDELIPCRNGDIFIMTSIDNVKERCKNEIVSKEVELEGLRKEIEDGRDELMNLKSKLYTKFGDSIRLDYD